MKWPWRQRETRASVTYTDAMATAAYARADGSPAKVAELAVAGAVARIYALALSLAKIEPAGSMAAGLLTPELRAMIGMQLILAGNSIFSLESGEDGLSAVPCTGFADGGDWRPSSWLYTVQLAGPGASYSRRRMGASVLHFKLEAEPRRPWAGISPLTRAGVDGAALSALTTQLRDAGTAPFGSLLNTGQFEDEDSRKAFEANLRSIKGGLAVVDRGDFNAAAGAGLTTFGLLAARLDQGLGLLRRDLVDSVAAACGLPPSLLSPSSSGTSTRESWRQAGSYFRSVGELLAEEVYRKLAERIEFDFSALATADVRMRASAFKSFVDAGLSAADAARLVAVDMPREGGRE